MGGEVPAHGPAGSPEVSAADESGGGGLAAAAPAVGSVGGVAPPAEARASLPGSDGVVLGELFVVVVVVGPLHSPIIRSNCVQAPRGTDRPR
jgi:hypothetical protein